VCTGVCIWACFGVCVCVCVCDLASEVLRCVAQERSPPPSYVNQLANTHSRVFPSSMCGVLFSCVECTGNAEERRDGERCHADIDGRTHGMDTW
jgi:hypothetical protein